MTTTITTTTIAMIVDRFMKESSEPGVFENSRHLEVKVPILGIDPLTRHFRLATLALQ
jgi:hypothetical protein